MRAAPQHSKNSWRSGNPPLNFTPWIADSSARATAEINMATSIQAPQQFKQPSRKGKKAWRKNVDVTAVQQGLENLRDEEIKGYHTTLSFIFLQG
jgi:hypothetical protein